MLDLSRYTSDYRSKKDIETALAWNAIKKTLESQKKSEIFGYISGVRITETSITLTTGKPLINAELSLLREILRANINQSFEQMGLQAREGLRLK